MDNVKKVGKPGHVINRKEITQWLQYMLLLITRNRLQLADYIENRSIGQSFNVLFDENEQRKVKRVRNSLFESDHFSTTVYGGKIEKMSEYASESCYRSYQLLHFEKETRHSK
jgi:hypothetical protein